jgi:hypothetical protein
MTSNGQGPSPRRRDGAPRRHGRGADVRRRDVGSQWGLLAAASHRDGGATPTGGIRWETHLARIAPTGARRPARVRGDDPGADFVLQAMQRAFQ